MYDNLPPEAQAKWLALSYVALPGSEGRGGGRGEGGGGGGEGRLQSKVRGRLLRVNAFDDVQNNNNNNNFFC